MQVMFYRWITRQNRKSLRLVLLLSAFSVMIFGCATNPLLFAEGLATDTLAPYEQMLFSHSYLDESVSERLNRLESSVYGEPQTGEVPVRQSRLIQTLSAARKTVPFMAPAVPVPATDGTSPNRETDAHQTDASNPADTAFDAALPDATDYPTLIALEREVFGRDFIREDIAHRLTRLEKKVFGQNYPQVAFVDRVDKLLSRYPNLSSEKNRFSQAQDGSSSTLRDLPEDPGQFIGSGRDVYSKIDALEKRFFNGKTMPNDLLTQRLERLEGQAFNRNYNGESVDTRLNRLLKGFELELGNNNSYAQAGRDSSFSVPQIVQPGYASPQIVASKPSLPQNIQIGAGFSSQSTHRFSPEMMSMLPPEVRAQWLSSSSERNSSATSIPGLILTPQDSVVGGAGGYPGFHQMNGSQQPLQYYNYYGSPASGLVQQTQTTTVLQPDGSSIVYGYPGAGSLTGTNQQAGNANPAYIGNPQFLQTLGNLEISVFGQPDVIEPVSIRLGRLESAILGQIYVGYAEEQRLSNLQKAYRLQSIGRLLGKGKAASVGKTAGSLLLGVPLTPPAPVAGQNLLAPQLIIPQLNPR